VCRTDASKLLLLEQIFEELVVAEGEMMDLLEARIGWS
jgi:hypothetical protein